MALPLLLAVTEQSRLASAAQRVKQYFPDPLPIGYIECHYVEVISEKAFLPIKSNVMIPCGYQQRGERWLHIGPSNTYVAKTARLHLRWAIEIAEVHHYRTSECRADAVQVEHTKLIPVSQDHKNVGARCAFVAVGRKHHARKMFAGLLNAFRIEGAHLRARSLERRNNRQACRVTHVIRVGLERKSERRDDFAGDSAIASCNDTPRHRGLTPLVHVHHRLDQPQR